jgi:hypothetical protein
MTLRLMGTLRHYDATKNLAQIEQHGHTLEIDTSLLGQFPFQIGSLFQFIGEVEMETARKPICLKARVGRRVEGIDMGMYQQVLEIRRNFLGE